MLRRSTTARFSELMRPTDLESDNFKFYLRSMIKEGWVTKTAEGDYQLSTAGKVFANNLNETERTTQRQPKLSVVIVVSRQTGGARQFLLHQRARHPFYGFWGFLSGPIRWGELPEEAAQRELMKQSGLEASLTARGIYRQRTYKADSSTLLEDGLFTVMYAERVEGEVSNEWQGGENRWVTEDEIQALTPRFKETDELLASLDDPPLYIERTVTYEPNEY